MIKPKESETEQREACEICEEQTAYICAMALDYACIQIGK